MPLKCRLQTFQVQTKLTSLCTPGVACDQDSFRGRDINVRKKEIICDTDNSECWLSEDNTHQYLRTARRVKHVNTDIGEALGKCFFPFTKLILELCVCSWVRIYVANIFLICFSIFL